MKNLRMKSVALALCLAGGFIGSVQAKKCFIGDLNKASILKALFWRAKTQGMGGLSYKFSDCLSEQEAEVLLKKRFIDYVRGRVMKVRFYEDSLYTDGYNRDNGNGLAEKIVNYVRMTDIVSPSHVIDKISTENELDTYCDKQSVGTKCIEKIDKSEFYFNKSGRDKSKISLSEAFERDDNTDLFEKSPLRGAIFKYVLNRKDKDIAAYRDAYRKCLKKGFKDGKKRCQRFISEFYKKEYAREKTARYLVNAGRSSFRDSDRNVDPKVFEEEI